MQNTGVYAPVTFEEIGIVMTITIIILIIVVVEVTIIFFNNINNFIHRLFTDLKI